LRNGKQQHHRQRYRKRFNPLARQRGCATERWWCLGSSDSCFNPLARQRGCATESSHMFRLQLGRFQSSCEATGLRNRNIASTVSSLTRFNPLARQRGCATRYTSSGRSRRRIVSILLRGNGVAQHPTRVEQLVRVVCFNPLARQRGCATTRTAKCSMRLVKSFNPLARQRGCATGHQHRDLREGFRFNPLARQRGCATYERIGYMITSEVSILLRGNGVAQQL